MALAAHELRRNAPEMTGMRNPKPKRDDRALSHSPVSKKRVVLDDDCCVILDCDDVSHNLPPTPGMPGLFGCG